MIDYTGKKFNKWNIIKFIELERFPKFRPGKGNFGYRYKYLCRCDCGTERILDISQVKSQISKSCGCLVTPKHTDLRVTYKEIKKRCSNQSHKDYPLYGGRGITLCDKWMYSYQVFYTDVMKEIGERPTGHTIDRINPDGNYEPGNIKWSTPKQQAHNKRKVDNSPEAKARRLLSKFFS